MTIEGVVILVACVLPAFAVAVVASIGQWRMAAIVRGIADEQSRQLMSFHQAGQSMAAHQLEMARISAKEREAEAALARAHADEERMRIDREMRMASSGGKFNGVPRVVGES